MYHVTEASNDVKENPGTTIYAIVNSNNTVHADFMSRDQAKFGENAGKQCVAMSLTDIIFVAREHNFEALIFLVAESVPVGILQAIFEKPCLLCQGFYSCYIFYSIVAIYSIYAPDE